MFRMPGFDPVGDMRFPSISFMPARLLSSSVCRHGVFPAVVAVAFALTATPDLSARRHKVHESATRLTQFARAEQMRDALESRPEDTRTRAEYERVLDAYRAVYHGNPADRKAAEAVNMVGGLLAEEGRIFHRDKMLLSAVGQFEFLRAQYPGSPYDASALLAEATIYLHDLHDAAAAKGSYEKFLKSYPHDPLAAQARAGLKEVAHQRGRSRKAEPTKDIAAETSFAHSSPIQSSQSQSAPYAPSLPKTRQDATNSSTAGNELTRLGAQTATSARQPELAAPKSSAEAAEGQPLLTGAVRAAAQEHRGKLPLVTNVRHWSTPVYTRVAIDLQDQVPYEAARVPNPDRIYFDLHGTRVAPELIGKTVSVTDDGFLQRIRVAQFSNDVTRIVLDVNQVAEYSAFFLPNPWRLIIDIHGSGAGSVAPPQQVATAPPSPAAVAKLHPPEPVATSNQSSRRAARALRDIAEVSTRPDQVKATSRPTTEPIAANVGASGLDEPTPGATSTKSKASRPAPPDDETADDDDTVIAPRSTSREAKSIDGQRSLTRALGLKIGRIVVDAGHGGHDSGTLGPGGVQEKDVVLDVALRLGKLLRQRLGADVIYTRDDDTFIPLEQRTAIANKAQADLFISVHANSSSDPTARGVETYYLNFTTSPDALEVAARENAVSNESIHELSGLVKKITLKDKIDESREFAADVDSSLYAGLERGNPGLRDRGVKKAPFVVLIGANMPSILAEISFLTNPDDATQLRESQYRERIAESLYRGVAKYVNGLSGLRVAQNSGHVAGD